MSESDIKNLKAQRANCKRMLTNFKKYLDNFVHENDYPVLEKRIKEIEHQRAIFDECQLKLEQYIEDIAHEEIRNEFEEKFYTALSKAVTLLNDSSRPSTSNAHVNQSGNRTQRKLPALNLPTFNGNYETWLGFHDLFKSLVEDNTETSDIEKFYHLKGCLRDEAADIIASLEMSAENYKVAWEMLKNRYDNRKVIRQSHINALLNLPVVSKEFSIRSFLDKLEKHIRSLKALKEPVDNWDTILVGIITQKLNSFLREKWEDFSSESPRPTYNELIAFLQRRAQFEDTQSHHKKERAPLVLDKKQNTKYSRPQQACSASVTKYPCVYCQDDHSIFACEKFKKLTVQARFEAAKKAALCLNCLRKGHRVLDCTFSPCRKCNKKHNIYLHFEKSSTELNSLTNNASQETETSSNQVLTCHAEVSAQALLATAVVDLVNDRGKSKICRVFLDGGSQANFITEETANFLNLPRTSVDVSVSGINNTNTATNNSVSGTVKSRFNNYQKRLEFLVLSNITKPIPSIPINRASLEIPKNIVLADPQFHQPGKIDLLIGVQLFFKLMCVGQIAIKEHPDAVLQKTQLGWIVAGELTNIVGRTKSVQCHLAVNNTSTSLESILSKFWEIEEIPTSKLLSKKEQMCEEHFQLNTQRNENGRYIVKLPFNDLKEELGDSRPAASRRLGYLEKRFEKSSALRNNYSKFLKEYEDLGHMSEIVNDNIVEPGVYLPHHAVIREESITTKIRVVFDGSAKTSSGISLNESLMTGPVLQNDLFSLLVRFRSHQIVITADIEKMYRQILIHPDDRSFQKILFRKAPDEPIKVFHLNTVTYGTSCAPYLAIRALHQLADDERCHHPLASEILKRDFYVDDLLTGAETAEKAKLLKIELSRLLEKGGFHLRKWASNDSSLVTDDPDNPNTTHMSLERDVTVKTLGIKWDFNKDSIFYSVNLSELRTEVTKRSILSEIARLFDPLGLLGPVIVAAKIIIQNLWKAGFLWDESVPFDVHTKWTEYRNQLPLLKDLQFQRRIVIPDCIDIQFHGFCDASEKAYGACIYLRSTDTKGNRQVSLVCSKSRVAPVSPVTLPRLELCAALVLTRLYITTVEALGIKGSKTYLWSDSTIALQWISTEAHTYKTFVANRVAEIQRGTQSCEWRHVPSPDNPADLVSRGSLPREFLGSNNWQNGPAWLSHNENMWPNQTIVPNEIPEKRKIIASTICLNVTIRENDLLQKYSSIAKLKRTIAYVLRFIKNTRKPEEKQTGSLTLIEIEESLEKIIKIVQCDSFKNEINCIKNGMSLNPKSKLIPLNPFLDSIGILRVGGRLARAELSENQKHPMLLPSNHHITHVIIQNEHLRLHHAGAQTTLYSVREKFWPLNGRNLTRKIVHQCIPCFRVKPRGIEQIMGDLPEERVSSARPFLKVGVDYCGPLYIKEKRFRNRNKIKVYVAIFVCMCTKAVHLEVVSDLTTEAFIASLKRLFSRRGKAKLIFSDNATNFVGASRELEELYRLVQSKTHNEKIQEFLLNEQISWNFIPPKAPHFGGLWEAAVKAFKHHFLRIVGDALLTFEQLETYTIEIEAILNSRPISPMSSDPNDLRPLTPGHFLIGGSLTSFPQRDFTDIPSNRLSQWEHAQKLRQHFWKRWQKEYLHQLITRKKWTTGINQGIQPGTLVIIKEDNTSPLQWKMGRVTEVYPGQDGVIRVVKVKTPTGEYKRCIQKLFPLPIE